MLGILIELIVSWLLLYLYHKTSLSVLGLTPTRQRLLLGLMGFIAAAIFCAAYYFLVAAVAANAYSINKSFGVQQFFGGAWWVLRSVLFEELIFRGALLYIAIKILGAKWACTISAVAFGVYHWFSFGALGNLVQMAIVFVMTATWGLMFAYAYAKTKTLWLPIGLHFGWNLINDIIFSKGPLGVQWLVASSNQKPEGIISLLLFLLQVFALPLLTWWSLRRRRFDL